MTKKAILEEALKLSPSEKIYLIDLLSDSLSEINPEVDKLWKKEVERRYHLYKEGKTSSIPYDDIFKS